MNSGAGPMGRRLEPRPALRDATRVDKRRAAQRSALGQRAEALACDHLGQQGFEIIGRNVRVGRLELDIIARRGRLLVFCEVRARSNDRSMWPSQTVQGRKASLLRRAVARWLREQESADTGEVRLDVASVVFDTPEGRLTYLEGAL